ncbi:hypothetical protein ICC28_37075 [Streptomyces sp. TRM68416]|nr:hypothetical protein [Streptomyces sp. TRM68416]
MILVPAVAAAALVGEAVTVPEAAKAASCTAKWEVTWKKVAVRKPAANQLVARPDSRVVRYLYRGDVVTSCYAAVARTESGPAYTKCGRGGNLWQIVRGGQVPQTCLKRV